MYTSHYILHTEHGHSFTMVTSFHRIIHINFYVFCVNRRMELGSNEIKMREKKGTHCEVRRTA